METDKEKNENNGLFLGILLMVLAILVFFFPKAYSLIKTKTPSKTDSENNKVEEVEKVSDEVLASLHYPIMRNSIYSSDSYYKLSTFEISNMSNNDILYNAFMDLYEGNIVNSTKSSKCSKVSKEFDSEYMMLRIKNILGKSVNYKFESFYVPEDTTSNYKGEWYYDSSSDSFVYNGLCSSKKSDTKYYDLKQFIKAEKPSKSEVVVYYYIGFAKVTGANYTIYSSADYTGELLSGTDSGILDEAFKSIDSSKKKIYKFTFKNTLCSYNEYCLYKGEYVDGI